MWDYLLTQRSLAFEIPQLDIHLRLPCMDGMADHGRDKAKKASIDFLLEALINQSSHPPSGVILVTNNGDNLRGQKPKPEVLQVNLLFRLPADLLRLLLDILKHTSYLFGSH